MTPLDWQRMLLDKFPPLFIVEVGLRALFAYVVVFVFLKISGRRGIRQLSLFELVVILTLGSAAGDVSFYEDVPLIPIATVFATLLLLYRFTVWLMTKSERFSRWMEGVPVTIIKDGLYELHSLQRLNISSGEFFMELRQRGVEHLGQVRLGILETDGNVSLFYNDAESVRPGLPVLPEAYRPNYCQIPSSGLYACTRCGFPQVIETQQTAVCPRCKNSQWTLALTKPRGQ